MREIVYDTTVALNDCYTKKYAPVLIYRANNGHVTGS
jgi:hypothetical protein